MTPEQHNYLLEKYHRQIDIRGQMATLRSVDFRVTITALSEKAGNGRYDWRVTVQRLTDGMTSTERVSGGWPVAETYATILAHRLGLDPEARL